MTTESAIAIAITAAIGVPLMAAAVVANDPAGIGPALVLAMSPLLFMLVHDAAAIIRDYIEHRGN